MSNNPLQRSQSAIASAFSKPVSPTFGLARRTPPAKVLLVDNDTHYKIKLVRLLERFDVTRVMYDELNTVEPDSFDLVILSGGGIIDDEGRRRSLKRFTHLYESQLRLIESATVPLIGICLGAQLIGHFYGADLRRKYRIRRKGVFPIVAIKRNRYMNFQNEMKVFQSNRWTMSQLPDELDCLAASDGGVEIMKHRDKPLFGLQFHPERRAEKNHGAEIFFRIADEVLKDQARARRAAKSKLKKS